MLSSNENFILGLDKTKPFSGYNSFAKWFERTTKKLKMNYNVHSIRHLFSINHYNKHKDIVKLQKALGHTSLLAKQTYLTGLKNTLD